MDESGHKTNRIWVNHGSKFYNRLMKSWLHDNDTEIYLTHKEGKSIVAERFIRTVEVKIYKHMTAVSENVYIGRLDEINDKYNNIYHGKIKINPADVKVHTFVIWR